MVDGGEPDKATPSTTETCGNGVTSLDDIGRFIFEGKAQGQASITLSNHGLSPIYSTAWSAPILLTGTSYLVGLGQELHAL